MKKLIYLSIYLFWIASKKYKIWIDLWNLWNLKIRFQSWPHSRWGKNSLHVWMTKGEGRGGERLPCWNDFSVIATISNLFATFHYFASQSPACHSTVPGPRPSLFLCHVSSSIQFFKWILTKVYLYIYILEVDRDTMKVNFSFLPFPYPMASCRLIYVPFFLYLERTFLSRSKKLLSIRIVSF